LSVGLSIFHPLHAMPEHNVLMVHGSSDLYGSDRVLLELASALYRLGYYFPIVLLPTRGPLFDALCERGIEVHVAPVLKISRVLLTSWRGLALPLMVPSVVRAIDSIVLGRRISLVHSNTLGVVGGAVWARLCRICGISTRYC
jgi:hypothetical protein